MYLIYLEMDIDKLIKEAILEKNGAKREAYRAIKTELLLNNSAKKPKEFGKDIREKITLEEFMEIVIPRLPDRHSKEKIKKIFQYFDLENTGKITARHLKKIAQEIGENLSDEELKEIMEEADRDGDGYIGFEDFYRIMKKRGDDPLEDWSDDEEEQ